MTTKLYPTGPAIAYINARLPRPWSPRSAQQSLDRHRRLGHITPEPVEAGEGRPVYLYRQSELDRFLGGLNPPGGRWADLPQGVIDRLGIETDTALAAEAGVSVSAVRRARKARGIEAAVKPGRGKG